MAGIKNYIHYHNNMRVLNKITDENLKEMIKQEVNLIIDSVVADIVNAKVEEALVNFVMPKHTHNYEEIENKPNIPSIEGLATKEELGNKVDKVEGKVLIDAVEVERLAKLENYDDTELNKALNELSAAVKGIEGSQGEVNLEGLATIDYVNECLGKKKLIYLTEAEYEALSEEEKGRDGIVYNIITNDML